MNKKPKVVVLGSINMDLVIRCAELPKPGQTILADSSAEFCGGKGANQAIAAAAAGGDVSMIGSVGNDAFAQRLIDNLANRGAGHAHVSRRQDRASGLALIAVDQHGQNSIMVVSGANATVTVEDVAAAKNLIQSSDVLLVQLEIPIDTVCAGITLARQAGVRVVLDPAPAPNAATSELLHVDLLCPNESEASALTGLPVETIDQAKLAAAQLHQMGAEIVAVTMGDQGTVLYNNGETSLIPSYPVHAVDTTAAGDAFAGALAVQWSHTNDLTSSIRFANAAGALAASKHGAQASMATRHEIETLWESSHE